MIEILSASKEHSEDAVRAGVLSARPGFKIQAVEDKGDEWLVRISDDEDSKPDFLKKKDESDDSSDDSSDEESEPKSDSDSEDSKDEGGDKKEKGDSDKGSVDKLRGLVDELTKTMEEVVQHAEDVAADADGKQQKMEEIHDSVKDHVKDGEKPGLGEELPPSDAPMPADGVGLEDIGPTPTAPPKGGPKPPALPGAKPKRPGMNPGGGIPTFTNVQVAQHPGYNEQGERISLVAAAAVLENDPEFTEYEVVGMVENKDGSYSAKLKRKSE
jgi:hypothetical protein